MKKILENRHGLTLIEILIVIAIIGFLSAASVSLYSAQQNYIQYTSTLAKVNSLIKTARSYAASSRAVYDSSQPAGDQTYIPPQGYGIYIEQTEEGGPASLTLFANTSTSGDFLNQFDAQDIVEEVMEIPVNAVLERIDLINLPPSSAITQPEEGSVIIFRPPLAETYIATNGDPSNITEPPTAFDTLELHFYRRGSTPQSSGQIISINRTAGFPEVEVE